MNNDIVPEDYADLGLVACKADPHKQPPDWEGESVSGGGIDGTKYQRPGLRVESPSGKTKPQSLIIALGGSNRVSSRKIARHYRHLLECSDMISESLEDNDSTN